jgi:hypothetical protein
MYSGKIAVPPGGGGIVVFFFNNNYMRITFPFEALRTTGFLRTCFFNIHIRVWSPCGFLILIWVQSKQPTTPGKPAML